MTQQLVQGDPYRGAKLRNIVQGEYDATSDCDVVFTTVLGSCVSACLFDDERGVGGINHFLLPDGGNFDQQSVKYGSMAMELLINAMLKKGARRQAMRAKLFGGARIGVLKNNIGQRNIEFALAYMQQEGFPVVSESLGGTQARRLQFKASTGHARINVVGHTQIVESVEPDVNNTPDITLF